MVVKRLSCRVQPIIQTGLNWKSLKGVQSSLRKKPQNSGNRSFLGNRHLLALSFSPVCFCFKRLNTKNVQVFLEGVGWAVAWNR